MPSSRGSPQPRVGASVIAWMRAPSPAAVSAVETASTLGEEGCRVSGSRKTQAAMPIAAIGTLTRKTEPHQKWSSSQPPMIGPSGRPSADAADMMPTSLVRSCGAGSTDSANSASGVTSAAPTPITAPRDDHGVDVVDQRAGQ